MFGQRFMHRNIKNIIRHESLLTLVAYTTQSRFTAEGKKKKPKVLDFSSDSLQQCGATQTNKRVKNTERKRSAGEFTTTAHVIFMKDVTTGERMRRRKEDLFLYILFTSYSPQVDVTHFLSLFFSRKCEKWIASSATCR